jgi:hypothetical protein
MKAKYLRMVDIGNQGAQDRGLVGWCDVGFSQCDRRASELSEKQLRKVYEDLKAGMMKLAQCACKNLNEMNNVVRKWLRRRDQSQH